MQKYLLGFNQLSPKQYRHLDMLVQLVQVGLWMQIDELHLHHQLKIILLVALMTFQAL